MSENPTANTVPLVAGDNGTLARRYVAALYAMAEQEKVIDAVAADMQALRRLWDESPEWRAIATDRRLTLDETTGATAQMVKTAGFGKLTANFLSVVAHNRRLSVLPVMIQCFLDEVASRRGEYNADIRAARPLVPAQREALASSLASVAGGKVNLAITEDPSIIGGMIVKIGSKLIDASVKTKLDLLGRSLKQGTA